MIALALTIFMQGGQDLATWPWKGVARSTVHVGVARWMAASKRNQTEAELIEFDFRKNPRLRLELFDQDAADEKPFDNAAPRYFLRGLGAVVPMINGRKRGQVLACWNGSFFGFKNGLGSEASTAFHIGPVVLNGKMHYNVGSPRWTFAVRQERAGPRFSALYSPSRSDLDGKATFAASGVQCVVKDGKPLRISPRGTGADSSRARPDSRGPEYAGSIPDIDYLHTSRTSMGWSKDGRKLWLLVVNEPDHETNSKRALAEGREDWGGFTLSELQRFWLSRGAWGAVNLDGGAMTQSVYLRKDRKYEMLPARLCSPNRRLVFGPDFKGAPAGGVLMYFYVLERK